MSDYAILDGHTPVPCELMRWAAWFEDAERRRVALTDIDAACHVSTVFLGLDHSFGRGDPLWFETVVFGGPHDGWMDRYTTWEQAERGHDRTVRALRRGEEPEHCDEVGEHLAATVAVPVEEQEAVLQHARNVLKAARKVVRTAQDIGLIPEGEGT